MYWNFDVLKRGEYYYADHLTAVISDEPEGPYYLKCEDWPRYFRALDAEEQELTGFQPYIFTGKLGGFDNYPAFRFDIDKYNAGDDPFIAYDITQDEWFQHAIRRMELSQRINRVMHTPTEIKKIRKAVVKIIELTGIDAEKVPELKDFIEYSDTIEAEVKKTPKDTKEFSKHKYALNFRTNSRTVEHTIAMAKRDMPRKSDKKEIPDAEPEQLSESK